MTSRASKGQAGSVVVESVIAIPILVLLISGVSLLAYVGFAQIWIHLSSYEAAVCLASDEQIHICQSRLMTRIHGALPGAKLSALRLSRNKRRAQVSFFIGIQTNGNNERGSGLLSKLGQHEERVLLRPLPVGKHKGL